MLRSQELAALSHPKTRSIPPATAQTLGLSTEDLIPFFVDRPYAQALERLEILAAWMAKINTQNHDGVTLTPALVAHLSSGFYSGNWSTGATPPRHDVSRPGPRTKSNNGARLTL